MMWLTEMKQDEAVVTIDGKSMSQTGVSDFVGNLESSGYFKRSIDIISSQTEQSAANVAEVVKFQLKATFSGPGEPPPPPAARGAAPGRGAAPPSAGGK